MTETKMHTNGLQLLETDGFIHIEVTDTKGNADRLVLSKKEWAFAIQCMQGTAEFYPYFDDVRYLIQINPCGFRIAEVPYNGGNAEVRIYAFPMALVAELYPAKRIWNEQDCNDIAKDWFPV